MRPAYRFPAVSACFALGAFVSFIAMARVLDVAMMPQTGETVGWCIVYGVLLGLAIWLDVVVTADGKQENLRKRQSQQNSETLVMSFVFINGVSLILVFLAACNVLRLRDALVATVSLGGPVATIWYWAASHSYRIMPFTTTETR